MLINLSNHPVSTWSKEQIDAAATQFGKVVDHQFPYVEPESAIEEVKVLAHQVFDQITQKYGEQDIQIHLMGEHSLVYQLILLFKEKNICCLVSTTHRIVEELQNGSKNVQFRFVQFRYYY